MPMFRKKPVIIEAMQWDGTKEGADLILSWTAGSDVYYGQMMTSPLMTIHIKTLEGELHASSNDWIIKGVKGEFYPCKPDIFAATYEAV